jgi:RNA polymerase sigma-70 factor (ECF subfamily)
VRNRSSIPVDESSDERLIRSITAGRGELFELLVRRHNRRIFRVAYAVLGSDDEAEDVVQQSFFNAYAHLKQFKGRAKFATWLTRIALREALARRRQRLRSTRSGGPGQVPEVESQTRTPEDDVSAREMISLLRAAFDALPERYRVVFMLRDVEGLSTTQTANCLRVSEQNVKVRLHRARTKLRQKISARTGATWADVFPFQGERCDGLTARVLRKLPVHDPLAAFLTGDRQ